MLNTFIVHQPSIPLCELPLWTTPFLPNNINLPTIFKIFVKVIYS